MKSHTSLHVTLCCTVVCTTTAEADQILWNQQPDPTQPAFFDQVFPDFPEFSTYQVHDVEFTAPILLQDITVYFTNQNATWAGAVTQGQLNIFEKVGTLPRPDDDPTRGITVSLEVLEVGETLEVTATDLNIMLDPGLYWIGLTPIVEFRPLGVESHLTVAPDEVVGDPSAIRNPGCGTFCEHWDDYSLLGATPSDGAITIQGTIIPAPPSLLPLGAGLLLAARADTDGTEANTVPFHSDARRLANLIPRSSRATSRRICSTVSSAINS